MAFSREITFSPAYDKRDRDPKKDYGIHGVDIRFVLKGELGATQFVMSTGWLLPETVGAIEDERGYGEGALSYAEALASRSTAKYFPSPTDLGYHSPHPRYVGQTVISDDCGYIGGPCYYDGSGLNAWFPFKALLREGHEGVWRVLEDYYNEVFKKEED